MVIKILKSSSVFQAVHYNENKIEDGEATLKSANNFGALDNEGTRQDFISYLKKTASLNPKVKNKQFHVIISAKGNDSHTGDDLNAIAKDYMKDMGYDKTPFLVYAHHDTDNRHVHIVGSRIDKNGKKVSDKFERVRSQKFIEQNLKIDFSKSVGQHIEEAFNYSISTVPQFKMLLERQNYIVFRKGSELIIGKGGQEVGNVEYSKVLGSLVSQKSNSTDKSKLKAILKKYSDGRSLSNLSNLTRSKFGIEIIPHYGKSKHKAKWPGHLPKNKPYGYTVINHNSKIVYKGSELVKLSYLLDGENRQKNLSIIKPRIDAALMEERSFVALQKDLHNHGYHVFNNGSVVEINKKSPVMQLSKEDLKKLKYFERVELTNSIVISEAIPKGIIARALFVKSKDSGTGNIGMPNNLLNDYRNKIASILQEGHSFEALFKKEQLQLISGSSTSYIYDRTNNVLLDIKKDLQIKIEHKLPNDQIPLERKSIENRNPQNLSNSISTFFKLVEWSFHDDGQDDNARKKKGQRKL